MMRYEYVESSKEIVMIICTFSDAERALERADEAMLIALQDPVELPAGNVTFTGFRYLNIGIIK